MGRPFRFVAWLCALALAIGVLGLISGFILKAGHDSGRPVRLGERAMVSLYVQLLRYAPFAIICAPILPATGVLAWGIGGRSRRRPSWVARGRSVLGGWLLAIPLAALGPVAVLVPVAWLGRDLTPVALALAFLGPLACVAAANYVALVLHADREGRRLSRVGPWWVAAAALVATVGTIGVFCVGGMAVPLWVLWHARREGPPPAIPAAA